MDEIAYVANATTFRMALLNKFGQSDFDVALKLSEDEDTCLTYRGYIKFLMTDLQDVYPLGPERTKSKFKRGIEQVAKQMLYRGDVSGLTVHHDNGSHDQIINLPYFSGILPCCPRELPQPNPTLHPPFHGQQQDLYQPTAYR